MYPMLSYAFVGLASGLGFAWFLGVPKVRCAIGLAGGLELAGGLGFAWFLGVPKVRYATPEKQRFWGRFGSDLGGVLAFNDVVFFDACGGFRWSVCWHLMIWCSLRFTVVCERFWGRFG